MTNLFNNMNKKKMITYGGIAIGVVVLLIVGLLLFYKLTRSDASMYSTAEQKLVSAAKEYYASRQGALPKELGGQITVDAGTLTSSGAMKELSSMVPKNKSCSGKVVITNVNYSYNYTAYLNCGVDYVSIELYKKVLDKEPVISSGMGLYKIGNEYVYRGENPNNYVMFANQLWRIVKIDGSNETMLILAEKSDKTLWDDRYNADRDNNDGINNYRVSRIRDFLKNYYNSDTKFSATDRLKIADHNLCIGKRSETASANDGSIECADILEKEAIGLLPIYDYMRASLDGACTSTVSGSCENYNYLVNEGETIYSWWTLTSDAANTHRVYRINGNAYSSKASVDTYVRPVIYLVNTAMFDNGTGTLEDPYTIR